MCRKAVVESSSPTVAADNSCIYVPYFPWRYCMTSAGAGFAGVGCRWECCEPWSFKYGIQIPFAVFQCCCSEWSLFSWIWRENAIDVVLYGFTVSRSESDKPESHSESYAFKIFSLTSHLLKLSTLQLHLSQFSTGLLLMNKVFLDLNTMILFVFTNSSNGF